MAEKPKDSRWIFLVLFLLLIFMFIGISYPTYTKFQVVIDTLNEAMDQIESWEFY